MSAEVFYRAQGLSGYWVVDVSETHGGEIEVLVEPRLPQHEFIRQRVIRRSIHPVRACQLGPYTRLARSRVSMPQ